MSKLSLFIPLLAVADAFKPGNFRMHVTTKKFCIDNIKDAQGNSAPCATSTSMATAGYTLPGMEDNSVTTREDVIVAHGGMVSVKAMPNRPYQFLMTTQTATRNKVDVIYQNAAHPVEQFDGGYQPSGAGSLSEDGWVQIDSDEASDELKWVKISAGGVDPSTGANFTHMFTAGIAPDTWTLFTDKAENPLRLVSTNSILSGAVYQEMKFTNRVDLPEDFSVEQASTEMYATYQISQDALEPLAILTEGTISEDLIPERVRLFYHGNTDLDWMRRRHLRESSVNGKGIAYFTIEKGSAAELYFNSDSHRHLASLLKFEYPHGCSNSTSHSEDYCLFINVDVEKDELAFNVGFQFVDVNDKSLTAKLLLNVALSVHDGDAALSLNLTAAGCAVVWQYGVSVNLNIRVCIEGDVIGTNLTDGDTRVIVAQVKASVTFGLHLPVAGNLIHWTIEGLVKANCSPHNVITTYGRISTSASVGMAGAGMGVDLGGKTVDNNSKKWDFDSGADFNAWVNIVVWKGSWNKRFQIWHAGPVSFN